MTKTIEFIDEKIRETERSIRTWKMMLKNSPNDEAIARCLNIREKEIQTFHQIKCELEAWEEVKKDKGVCKKQEFWGKDCKKVIQISCKTFPEGTEQYEKLKKTLEVENE